MFDSIILDLDGTLWDTFDVTLRLLNEVAKKYNLKEITDDVVKNGMGKTFEENVKVYFPDVDSDKQKEYTVEAFKNINEYLYYCGGRLYPFVEEVIKTLSKKYNLYIVSNNTKEYINSFLNSSKLSKYFNDYRGNELYNDKGKNIKDLIEKNNLKNSVYVGDTYIDKMAAKKAGIPFVFASYGFGNNIESDYKINNLKELLDL